MASKFTLQLEVVVDETHVATAVEIARRVYASGDSTPVDGSEQRISPKQFIGCTEQALVRTRGTKPLFNKTGIVVEAVSCGAERAVPQQTGELEIPSEANSTRRKRGFTFAAA